MTRLALADDVNDILGKAQRGLGLSHEDLARKAGMAVEEVKELLGGTYRADWAARVAPVLGLGLKALSEAASGEWHPAEIVEINGLAAFTTRFESEDVNAFLVWDPASLNGLCFDSGADAAPVIRFAAERQIRIQMVLLTHAHSDHVADLDRLLQATDAKAFASKLEPFPGAETFEHGRNFRAGNLIIGTRLTSGHSPGGTTYVVEGLARRLAVVGDAIFAGSMGGGLVSYPDALRNNRMRILTLPEDTILCPGHGPTTTVGEEKLHNPFFAA